MDLQAPAGQFAVQAQVLKGFSLTVTSTAAKILTTGLPCVGVLIQSSSLNDSDAAVTGKMQVITALDSKKIWELVQGESQFFPCANTDELKVGTQSGTAWCRGFVYQVAQQ